MDRDSDGGEEARISAWLDVLGVTRDALGESLCDPVRAAEATEEQLAGLHADSRAAVKRWEAWYWDAYNVVWTSSATAEDLDKVRRVARHLSEESLDKMLLTGSDEASVEVLAVLVAAGGDPIETLSEDDAVAVLERLGDYRERVRDGQTMLLRACNEDFHTGALVRTLLSAGACVNAATEHGITPLHVACNGFSVNNDVVQILLDAGADVQARTTFGYTPLRAACEFGHVDTAVLLLRHGARMTAEIRQAWDAGDSEFPEVLHDAVEESRAESRAESRRRDEMRRFQRMRRRHERMASDRRAALWGALACDSWGEFTFK